MSQVEAVFRRGVFEPLGPVSLHEEQRVRLRIEPSRAEEALAWLSRVRGLQSGVVQRLGYLPDSTGEISADRLR